jgi:hypothetical protein
MTKNGKITVSAPNAIAGNMQGLRSQLLSTKISRTAANLTPFK